ncbi:hypothetical protein ABHF33_13575 [Chitinibacter sp. FCG-7]|uniref:Uncharacterized protein n=1 Tax=Chitinibacter mangrovi TaxID=3153927 RepID=A0AAU7F5X8_9NEIS
MLLLVDGSKLESAAAAAKACKKHSPRQVPQSYQSRGEVAAGTDLQAVSGLRRDK